jgi:diguanylate cyclase (GGDEF)-like protein/PAS domain S-box-containing protein
MSNNPHKTDSLRGNDKAPLALSQDVVTSRTTAQLLYDLQTRSEFYMSDAKFTLMQYAAIIESSEDAIFGIDLEGIITSWNVGAERMFGYSREEIVGQPVYLLIPDQHQQEEFMLLGQVRNGQSVKHYETIRRCKDGSLIDISVSFSPIHDAEGNIVGAAKVARNISASKQAEAELRIAATAFETRDAIMITDANANIIKVNRAFTLVTGYSQEEVLGKNPRIMNSGRHDKTFFVELFQKLLRDGSWEGEIWDKRKNGEIYPRWMTITAVKDAELKMTQYVSIFSDITDRKKNEELINKLAFYDTLTQLPNRRMLTDRLRQSLAANKRSGFYGAVIFIDLDNFKPLNDLHGHGVGDLLLIEAGRRLSNCVREMDTVARFGGDEFVVMLSELSMDKAKSKAEASVVAEKIRVSLAELYMLTLWHEGCVQSTVEHHCTCSIGMALFDGEESSQEKIIKRADAAMYLAKEGGRNSICCCEEGMLE